MKKVRIGLLFGGQSGEHEVSIASALSVLRALDRDKYEPVLIGITQDGKWISADSPGQMLEHRSRSTSMELGNIGLHATASVASTSIGAGVDLRDRGLDVVFPLLHGPFGEDGTVQGLLELTDMPYVGSGVMASAVSMDKAMMKMAFMQEHLPVVPYQLVKTVDWRRNPEKATDRIETALTYPVFVKPCNLGSSVGISKAHDRQELSWSLDLAARFDRRIIVEQSINAREIECGVLGNYEPMASVPGEIVPHHDFYDYEAKYTEGLADLIIPANLSAEQTHQVQDIARRAFLAVDGAGLARVDFFVDRADGTVVLNELNTMPGFTATSMYPKLWEASGVTYSDLIKRLVELAIDRHRENQERNISR